MTKLKASFTLACLIVAIAGIWLLSGKPTELVQALQPIVVVILCLSGAYFITDRICDTLDKRVK